MGHMEEAFWSFWRLWLRDDLAKHTPESRIFIYEYNSSYIFGGEKARFIDKADELLEDLRLERRAVSHPNVPCARLMLR